MTLLNVFQAIGGVRSPVSCTWNNSLLGAYQMSKNPSIPLIFVCVMLLITSVFVGTMAVMK